MLADKYLLLRITKFAITFVFLVFIKLFELFFSVKTVENCLQKQNKNKYQT